jgi:hypothetical protein
MLPLCESLKGDIFGVLGNHDTIRMVPDLERMGVRMLLNEHVMFERNGTAIFMAGIDDAHFYHMDNIEKAAADIPQDAFSVSSRTRRKPISMPHMPGSICCWRGIRMVARSAFRAAFRSSSHPRCRAAWARAHGNTTEWRDIPRSALDPAAFRSVSTARRK